MAPVLRTLLLLLACGHALADDAGLLRCRAIPESGPRLACYDALPIATATKSTNAVPASSPTTAPTATVSTEAPKQTAGQFGLDQAAAKAQLDAIESRIEGKFEGWNARAMIALANGQVWQVTDGSRAVLDLVNPKVTVRRGFMSAYYMEFEGSNQTARVKRVK